MKKLFLILLLIFLTGCSLQPPFGAGLTAIQQEIKDKPYLKLKVDKNKIYKSKIVDDIRCSGDVSGRHCDNVGKIVEYYYPKNIKDGKHLFNGKIKLSKNEKLLGATGNEITITNLEESSRDYNLIDYKYDTTTTISEVFVGVQFIKELATGDWYELETPATTTVKAFAEQTQATSTVLNKIKEFFGYNAQATSEDFYPDPDVETNSFDGYLEIYNNANTWATSHDAATSDYTRDTDNSLAYNGGVGWYRNSSGKYQALGRAELLFYTASIPDTATINSATLALYANQDIDNGGSSNDYVVLCSSNPASNTGATNSDYAAFGTTAFSDTLDFDTNSGAYAFTLTLNATGLAAISKTTTPTKFGLRQGDDILNNNPGAGGDAWCGIFIRSADYTGTTYDPKLTVVYSDAVAAAPAPDDGLIIFE